MRITDMPWWNRPSNRAKRKGISDLKEDELLAMVIWRGTKEENALEIANRLLKKYNFHRLANLSVRQLKKELGDEVKAMRIHAMFELYKKTKRVERKGHKQTIESAQDVYNYFVDELKDKKKEHFYALLLDSKNRIIKEELISVGILDSSYIHPREVFKSAIRESAKAIILVHNHPSGDCSPSAQDEEVTKKLVEVGNIMGIKILDHVIIGKSDWFSIEN